MPPAETPADLARQIPKPDHAVVAQMNKATAVPVIESMHSQAKAWLEAIYEREEEIPLEERIREMDSMIRIAASLRAMDARLKGMAPRNIMGDPVFVRYVEIAQSIRNTVEDLYSQRLISEFAALSQQRELTALMPEREAELEEIMGRTETADLDPADAIEIRKLVAQEALLYAQEALIAEKSGRTFDDNEGLREMGNFIRSVREALVQLQQEIQAFRKNFQKALDGIPGFAEA